MAFDTTFSPIQNETPVLNRTGDFAYLGKDANKLASYTISVKNNRSITRLKLLDTARRVLARHDVRSAASGNRHRTRNCHSVPAYQQNIFITLNSDDNASSAGLSGLQTCGSICSCPVCATKKMVDYGNDIRKALLYAESVNLRPIMLTLTAKHTRQMTLKYFQEAFRDSYNFFQRNRRWKRIKKQMDIRHQITSREITHGKNGWHYHMHILFFVPVSSVHHASNATQETNILQSIWMDALKNNGLEAKEQIASQLSGKNASDTYLAKLGFEVAENGDLAYELTGNENKGKTVFDLLAMAHYGDIGAETLYVEYVQQMQGHKWVTFSNGFKDLFKEIELEQTPVPENQKLHRWLLIDNRTWYAVARLNKVAKVVKFAAKHRDKEKLRCLLQSLSEEWYYGQERIVT